VIKTMKRFLGVCAMAAGVLGASGGALAEPVRTGHTLAELISERAAVVPGDLFLGALRLDLDDGGWHVYWKNVGDSGLPPKIDWELPEGVSVGEFTWPAPHAIPLATLMNYGYEHQLVLPFEIRLPQGATPGAEIELKGRASWLICLETCIPEQADLVLRLPVAASLVAAEASGSLIADALAAAPVALTGEAMVERTNDGFRVGVRDDAVAAAATSAASVRFFPDGPEIIHAAAQTVEFGPEGLSVSMTASEYAPAGEAPLSGVVVLEGEDGSRRAWVVAATPAALPAGVSGTTLSPAAAGLTLLPLLSLLGAAFLGGLVLNLMPCVLPVLSIKAAGLVHTAHNPAEARLHGVAYTLGVLVCFAAVGAILVALRMAGEQAGLGFQLQYPPMVAVFALIMFAVGLNLLGVFEIGGSLMGVGGNLADRGGASGAFFTGLLAAFVGAPCVGPFMAPAVGVALSQPPLTVMGVFLVIGLGLAAPFLLLSFTPAIARLIPKPGAWMAVFRQALAFPMFLTAIWLLWVLGGQTGADGVIAAVAGATVFAFGVWLAGRIGSGISGRAVSAGVILLAVIGTAMSANMITAPAEAAQGVASSGGEVSSEPWSPERVKALQADGRVIFVDFTARWCATCQVNKKLAIETDEAKAAFAEYDVAFLVADWTNRDSVIAAALAEHQRAGVPLYLMYPASGGPPEVLPQMLTPGLIAAAVRTAAGPGASEALTGKGDGL
jgi:thiol:disulfide interchange protein DsbD